MGGDRWRGVTDGGGCQMGDDRWGCQMGDDRWGCQMGVTDGGGIWG